MQEQSSPAGEELFFFNLDLMQPLKYSFHINIYQLQISEVTHFSFLMELSEGELTLPQESFAILR